MVQSHEGMEAEQKQNIVVQLFGTINLIEIAFITGNSSLVPLIEGLCAQIHVNLS